MTTGSWVLDTFIVGCVILVLVPAGACVRAMMKKSDDEDEPAQAQKNNGEE